MGFNSKASNKTLIQQLKPIIIVYSLLGRFPYVIRESGQLQFKLISLSSLYCILSYSVQTYINIFSIQYLYGIATSNDVDFKLLIHALICLFMSLINLYLPLEIVFETPKVVLYFKKWENFQDLYFETTRNEYFIGNSLTVTIGISLVISFTIILLTHRTVFVINYYFQFQLIGYFCTFLGGLTFIVLWHACHQELRRAGEKLKNKIKQAVNKNSINYQKSELPGLRKLWVELSELVRLTGDSLAISSLVYITLCCICFITSSYAFLSDIKGDNSSRCLMVMIITSLCIACICESSYRTTRKVGLEVLWTLSNLDLDSMHPSRACEVRFFIETIKNKYPVIDLDGFTVINRSTLVKIAANIFTYLIVLVQLQSLRSHH